VIPRFRPYLAIFSISLSFLGLAACSKPQPFSHQVRQELQSLIEPAGGPSPMAVDSEHLFAEGLIAQFYSRRDFSPAWSDDRDPGSQAGELVRAIRMAIQEGLEPRDYHLEKIELLLQDLNQISPPKDSARISLLAQLDLLLTDAFLVYASHLCAGKVDPVRMTAEWPTFCGDRNLVEALEEALDSRRVEKTLQDLAPQHSSYQNLKKTLQHYRRVAQEGGSPTRGALNIPLEKCIRQIELNLERWRWLPGNLGPRFVHVNVADFRLNVIEGGKPVMSMKVVAGNEFWPTPDFSSEITHLVFNPSWTVPPHVLLKEVSQYIQKDQKTTCRPIK
jgi:murein L,D-transpeptidase YcbB/YkuD